MNYMTALNNCVCCFLCVQVCLRNGYLPWCRSWKPFASIPSGTGLAARGGGLCWWVCCVDASVQLLTHSHTHLGTLICSVPGAALHISSRPDNCADLWPIDRQSDNQKFIRRGNKLIPLRGTQSSCQLVVVPVASLLLEGQGHDGIQPSLEVRGTQYLW